MTKYQRIICLLLLLTTIYFTCLVIWQSKSQCEYKGHEEIKPIQVVEVIEVNDKTTFTAYTLSVDETDDTPCIGSANNNLCELRKEMLICASRDLPLDTVIYIENIGECVIKDRLNKRYKGSNRVDILMETRQEALNFGKRELKYVIVK